MIRSLATSAVALIAGAAPVLADLTPSQVWDSLESYYTTMGYKVETGQRDEAGDTLTLSDITLSPEAADSATTMTVKLPRMILQQTGDAKVRTTIDGDVTVDSTTTPPEGEPVEFDATIAMPENEMTSSGTPDAMVHDFVYPQIKIDASFKGAGEPTPLTVTMQDVRGSQANNGGPQGNMTFQTSAAGVDLTFSATEAKAEDGSGGGKIDGTARIENLSTTGTMKLPSEKAADPQAIHLALASGMALDGMMEMGKITGAFNFDGFGDQGQPESGKATYAAAETSLTFSLSKDGLSYSGSGKDNAVEMSRDSGPFPISYSVAEVAGQMTMPIMAAEDPQPFSLSYSLQGLSLGDGIWGLVDPQSKLPHDPANLDIALSGNAVITSDLLDPALADKMQPKPDATPGAAPTGPESPFQGKDLTIDRFALDALGAKADLTGQLDFGDNPTQPVGKIEGSFTGINTLLDTLTAMGFLPQEQLMATRMMLAMFARPSESDPNVMTTELEFREGGSIFANGQQVK